MEDEKMASLSGYFSPKTPERPGVNTNGDAVGPFNFQTATMAKSPVIKSVR
jgi:hypothetical protein